MTDLLRLPPPQRVRLTDPSSMVEQAIAIRKAVRDLGDIELADELRRQLDAYQKYVSDKKTRQSLAGESRRTEVLIGDLLGPKRQGERTDLTSADGAEVVLNGEAKREFRILAAHESLVEDCIGRGITTRRQILAEIEKLTVVVTDQQYKAGISQGDAVEWLQARYPCDLLLTDPPYSTDVEDVAAFAASWLPIALADVKPTGRAYICIGAYPVELAAYLNVAMPTQVLVWTYRNTLGPSPTYGYKLNWQAILYYQGADAAPLNAPQMTEQFSVQDINAPDARQGDRWHAWQKPDTLAERLIRHSTQPDDIVHDPFAGTGTFILSAARLGRIGLGCERDPDMIEIAMKRGCQRA